MVNWSKLRQDLQNVLGYDALRVNPDGKQAMVVKDNTPMAIFISRETDGVYLHLRASILPNEAAMIAAVTVYSNQLDIGENFEFDKNGTWLYGDSALKFFIRNAEEMWPAAPKSAGQALKLN